jgi:hypothetical protein
MSAERVALERLVEECEAVLGRLGELSEKDLEAWLYNCWYQGLIEARAALIDGVDHG